MSSHTRTQCRHQNGESDCPRPRLAVARHTKRAKDERSLSSGLKQATPKGRPSVLCTQSWPVQPSGQRGQRQRGCGEPSLKRDLLEISAPPQVVTRLKWPRDKWPRELGRLLHSNAPRPVLCMCHPSIAGRGRCRPRAARLHQILANVRETSAKRRAAKTLAGCLTRRRASPSPRLELNKRLRLLFA